MPKDVFDKMSGKVIITKQGSHTIQADFHYQVFEILFSDLKSRDSQCVFTDHIMEYTGLAKCAMDIEKRTYTVIIESDKMLIIKIKKTNPKLDHYCI